jgi:hypothetical protein
MTKIIQYLPQLESKTYEIVFIKSFSSRGFQKFQKHTQISLKTLTFTLLKKLKKLFNIQYSIILTPWV